MFGGELRGGRDGERRESKRANKAENEKQDKKLCSAVFVFFSEINP
jgi:hypothetical protein